MQICTECGQEFENEGHRRRPFCLSCALKHMREAAEQMANREGPYYEKWLLSKAKAVENYRARMEKAIKNYEESLTFEEHLASPLGQAENIIASANFLNGPED